MTARWVPTPDADLGHLIEQAPDDGWWSGAEGGATDPWSEAPDPEAAKTLERLLLRIPPAYAFVLRGVWIEGRKQREIGEVLGGISQPSIHQKIKKAKIRAAMVATHLPDLLPGEVEEILLARLRPDRLAEKEAAAAKWYWQHHECYNAPWPQRTTWERLFLLRHPKPRKRVGLVARFSDEMGVVGDIARGLRTIQGWPRVGKFFPLPT